MPCDECYCKQIAPCLYISSLVNFPEFFAPAACWRRRKYLTSHSEIGISLPMWYKLQGVYITWVGKFIPHRAKKGICSIGIRSFTLLLLPLSPLSLLLSPHSFSTHSITPPPLSHSFSSLTLSFTPSSLLLPNLSLPISPLPLSHSPSSPQMHPLFSFSYYHSLSPLPSLLSKSSLSLLLPFSPRLLMP